MISERLKFYADTPRGEKNKPCCFRTDILNLEAAITRFFKSGYNIRAAWYEKIEEDTGGVIENKRIPKETLQAIFDKLVGDNARKKCKK